MRPAANVNALSDILQVCMDGAMVHHEPTAATHSFTFDFGDAARWQPLFLASTPKQVPSGAVDSMHCCSTVVGVVAHYV